MQLSITKVFKIHMFDICFDLTTKGLGSFLVRELNTKMSKLHKIVFVGFNLMAYLTIFEFPSKFIA